VKVTAAVIERGEKLLIARRKPGKHMGGKWEFPGGKIEPGETPEQSLARELAEELEIGVEVGELLCEVEYSGDGVELDLLVYRVRLVKGEPVLREHDEIKWEFPRRLASYDLADSDRQVVEKLYR
jgi:8-oxo-dGTP diphosphatase